MLRAPPRRRRAGPPPERPRERGGIAVAEQVGDPPEREVALGQVALRQLPPQPLDQARRRQAVLGHPPPQAPPRGRPPGRAGVRPCPPSRRRKVRALTPRSRASPAVPSSPVWRFS